MSGPLVCVDLDRTIIYSPAALALTMPDEQAPRLLCVEVYRSAPLSFVTERAAGLLLDLDSACTLVPVTTRTPEQLARVRLPVYAGAGGSAGAGVSAGTGGPRFAIASNGGRLIVDGVPDEGWDAAVAARLRGVAPLTEVHQRMRAGSDDFVQTLRVADGLFVYAVVDRAGVPAGWIEELTAFCAGRGWTVSLQGRKVYCVPQPLTKSAAVAEVALRTGSSSVLAAGDSLLDQELLEVADRAIRPAAGELADAGWTAPHVRLAATPGVLGGEEILTWLLTEVRQGDLTVRDTPLELNSSPSC